MSKIYIDHMKALIETLIAKQRELGNKITSKLIDSMYDEVKIKIKAIEEIYSAEIARMTDDPLITSIPADKEAVVLAADIKSAAERHAEEEEPEIKDTT